VVVSDATITVELLRPEDVMVGMLQADYNLRTYTAVCGLKS